MGLYLNVGYIKKVNMKKMNKIAEKTDSVNHPLHYTTNSPIIKIKCAFDCACGTIISKSIECIDVIRNMPTWKGNAIKYLWRAGLKKDASLDDRQKEIEDLEKAVWYIQDRIQQLKEVKV